MKQYDTVQAIVCSTMYYVTDCSGRQVSRTEKLVHSSSYYALYYVLCNRLRHEAGYSKGNTSTQLLKAHYALQCIMEQGTAEGSLFNS